jgi:NADH-quinone oxidoreductase subunit K
MVSYQLPLTNYLMVSAILFVISVAGIIINRRNLIVLLMCIELMLLSVNTNFVAFATYGDHIVGEIFVFFILTVAAAESAIGLAIVIIYFRQKSSIDMSDMNVLKG